MKTVAPDMFGKRNKDDGCEVARRGFSTFERTMKPLFGFEDKNSLSFESLSDVGLSQNIASARFLYNATHHCCIFALPSSRYFTLGISFCPLV